MALSRASAFFLCGRRIVPLVALLTLAGGFAGCVAKEKVRVVNPCQTTLEIIFLYPDGRGVMEETNVPPGINEVRAAIDDSDVTGEVIAIVVVSTLEDELELRSSDRTTPNGSYFFRIPQEACPRNAP